MAETQIDPIRTLANLPILGNLENEFVSAIIKRVGRRKKRTFINFKTIKNNMRYTIENGTDGACMALYDREALPDKYDINDDDVSPDFEELQEQGRCVFVHTDGDGQHWLHLYIGEQEPEELEKYSINHLEIPELKIPSGKLYYTGCEYVSYKETDFSKKHPHMIKFISIDKGTYSADIHFLQYPDSFLKKVIREKLSKKSRFVLNMHKSLGYIALIGIGLTFVIGPMAGFKGVLFCLIPLAIWFSMFWVPGYAKAGDEKDVVMSELPSVLAKFEMK